MRVIRSGRRNISASVGEVTSLKNPVRRINGKDTLVFDADTRVLQASAAEFSDIWKVTDKKLLRTITNCVPQSYENYLASLGDCPEPMFTNRQVSKSFHSTECLAGMQSKDVVYTVWAGIYASNVSQAAADAMAMADIDANGQAYANSRRNASFITKSSRLPKLKTTAA